VPERRFAVEFNSRPSILQQTPLLSQEELFSYVEHYFNLSGKYLNEIVRNGSPLYILDTSILKERGALFKKAFMDVLPDTAFYYAMKSNNHPDVVRTLLDSGFGLDVSSGMELETAVLSGAENIVFSGPGKTRDELSKAVKYSDRVTVLIDSFGELARLQEAASAEDRIVRTGVRLSASKDSLWRKFGIAPEELPLFLEDALKCSHINFCGIQFHCSWNCTPEAQVSFISKLGRILSGLPDHFREGLEFIDIGGGYWPPQGDWLQPAGTKEGKIKLSCGMEPGNATDHYSMPSTSIEDFAEQLGSALRKYIFPVVSCKICFEPGRWICNDAMHIIVTVVDKKSDDLVVTDAGTNAVGWERFEIDYCPVLNLSRPSLQERECHVMGSLCTPRDIWGYTYWGDDIQEGDLLMIPEQGAYTYSLRQSFIKPLPQVITL
jgi:diaminopimelate decarboxylase